MSAPEQNQNTEQTPSKNESVLYTKDNKTVLYVNTETGKFSGYTTNDDGTRQQFAATPKPAGVSAKTGEPYKAFVSLFTNTAEKGAEPAYKNVGVISFGNDKDGKLSIGAKFDGAEESIFLTVPKRVSSETLAKLGITPEMVAKNEAYWDARQEAKAAKSAAPSV